MFRTGKLKNIQLNHSKAEKRNKRRKNQQINILKPYYIDNYNKGKWSKHTIKGRHGQRGVK